MSTKAITPRLAESLRLLAVSQLQTQVSRSVALDASALGVMAIDAAVTAIVIGTGGAYDLWILTLTLLGLSFGLAVRAGRLPGAEETGPLVDAVLKASETEEDDDEVDGRSCAISPRTCGPTGGRWRARVRCSIGHRRSW